ncbi:TPA: hypothetical protein ACGO2U_001991 [Streptococcus suis]
MINWTGYTTDKRTRYTEKAESYQELFEKLVDREIFGPYWTNENQTGMQVAQLSDILESIYDRIDEGDEDAIAEFENFDFDEEIFSKLSDNDWELLIRSCNSQAYYQEFEVIG